MKASKMIVPHSIWGTNCDGWQFMNSDKLNVMVEKMPPHTTETRHYHKVAQQFFYMVSGIGTLELEGEMIELLAGEGMAVFPGQKHTMMNNSQSPIEFLVISTPPTKGDRYNLS